MDEERLEALWPAEGERPTLFGSVAPLLRGVGDVRTPRVHTVADGLGLVAGDLALSRFEDEVSQQWPDCLDGKERAFRVLSAFARAVAHAADAHRAELVLLDVGPNLGALNRAALVASTHVLVPLAPDLFSLQGLRNLGPTLRDWRDGWERRLVRAPADLDIDLPAPGMRPVGYVLQQHGIRLGRATSAYGRWMSRIPQVYASEVLAEAAPPDVSLDADPHCLAQLKHYRSLMPMAQEARKPVFHLTPADGAFGGHAQAAARSRLDFRRLADEVAGRVALPDRVEAA